MERQSQVHSLGTSTRSKAEFAELLQIHDIEMVLTVCRFVTTALSKRGWQVEHIIDEKRTWAPSKSGQ
jgi:hypothetical protein